MSSEPSPAVDPAAAPVEDTPPTTKAATPAIPSAEKTAEPEADPKTENTKTPPPTKAATAAATAAATTTTPLSKLFAELPSILTEAGHSTIWGVHLSPSQTHIPSTIVLEKFLRANGKDVIKAKDQLVEALKWRKEMDVEHLLKREYDRARFGDLGFVTVHERKEAGGGREIVTWNIYGGVKDVKATFGDVQEFIAWRVALMELSLLQLSLDTATAPIPADGPDPYRMVQVHDYLNVSFLRMDPTIRAATKETIRVFGMAYPELLREKFFVNVPVLMGWVFTFIKPFLAPETVKKFHPLSYGSNLAAELKDVGDQLPSQYGGKGKDLKTVGKTVTYASAPAPAVEGDEAKE